MIKRLLILALIGFSTYAYADGGAPALLIQKMSADQGRVRTMNFLNAGSAVMVDNNNSRADVDLGGLGGIYLLSSGATTGATAQAQAFTNGIVTPSITSSTGAISFDNENLSTTGTLGAGATTVDSLTTDVGGITLLAGQDIRPSANSTTALNIAQADGTDFVIFDTTNKRMGIGGTPTYKLSVEGGQIVSHQAGYANPLGYIVYADNGKACAMSVGSLYGSFLYDDAGGFSIQACPRASVLTGTGSSSDVKVLVSATNSNLLVGTTDDDGTPATGRLVVKGSTNDGTTNIFVGRDSDEVNVATLDTNGNMTLAGAITGTSLASTRGYNLNTYPTQLFNNRGIQVLTSGNTASNYTEPSVIYESSTFKMWYRKPGAGIWYATSTDGYTFTPVQQVIAQTGDDHYNPFVCKIGATYYCYAKSDGMNSDEDLWTSADGITWALTKASTLVRGGAGTWDDAFTGNKFVWLEGAGDYRMLYDATDGSRWCIGYATSADGQTWVKSGSNPVLSFAEGMCGGPYVKKVGTTYYMFFHGSLTGNLPTDIYCAYSTNLTTWTLTQANPIFVRQTPSEGFDNGEGQISDPHFVENTGITYMYYEAVETQAIHQGFWVATTPYSVDELGTIAAQGLNIPYQGSFVNKISDETIYGDKTLYDTLNVGAVTPQEALTQGEIALRTSIKFEDTSGNSWELENEGADFSILDRDNNAHMLKFTSGDGLYAYKDLYIASGEYLQFQNTGNQFVIRVANDTDTGLYSSSDKSVGWKVDNASINYWDGSIIANYVPTDMYGTVQVRNTGDYKSLIFTKANAAPALISVDDARGIAVDKIFFLTGLGAASAGTTVVLVAGTNEVRPLLSTREQKDNITDLDFDSSAVFKLKPVSFNWKGDGSRDFGLIAEDTFDVLPQLVNLDNGKPISIKYYTLSVLLLDQMKKQETRIDAQQKQIDDLKARLDNAGIK